MVDVSVKKHPSCHVINQILPTTHHPVVSILRIYGPKDSEVDKQMTKWPQLRCKVQYGQPHNVQVSDPTSQ